MPTRQNQNNIYVSDIVAEHASGLVKEPKLSRRDALKYISMGAIVAIATSTGCTGIPKKLHNLINDYALVLDVNGNMYRFQGMINTPKEKEGYEILKPKRDIIANDLIEHMDEESIDKFTNALFTEMNANKAGTILYQNFNNGNIKDYQKLANSLIKVDPYIDWKDVGLVAVGTAAVVLGALYGFGVIGNGGTKGGSVATSGGGAVGP